MFEDVSFYSRALRMNSIPSTETLRQRLDYLGKELFEGSALQQANTAMLNASGAEISACFSGHFPLDVDVSVHDNSNTKKEGVQYTYKGVDGYAPIYAYLGLEGYMVGVQLRPGSDHSQNEKTDGFLREIIATSKQLVPGKLLLRLDSGNDDRDNIRLCLSEGVDFLIKRNHRRETAISWLETAQFEAEGYAEPREGKQVYTGSEIRDIGDGTFVRVVFQVTVRTIDKKGQILLTPGLSHSHGGQTWP